MTFHTPPCEMPDKQGVLMYANLSHPTKEEINRLVEIVDDNRQRVSEYMAENTHIENCSPLRAAQLLNQSVAALTNRSFAPHLETIIKMNRFAVGAGLTSTLSQSAIDEITCELAKHRSSLQLEFSTA